MIRPGPLVVIVTYNSERDIADCVEAVASQDVLCNIAVIDNASTDNTVKELEELKKRFDFLDFVANAHNDGFGKSCNQAVRRFRISAQPVLFLNPDCVLSSGSMRRMLEMLDWPDVGLATLRLETENGLPDPACARRSPDVVSAALHAIGWRRGRNTAGYNVRPACGPQVLELEATVGALMMLSGRCLDDVGPFDEQFWMYGEDLDLCARIRQAGYRILQSGEPVVIHRKGRSSGNFRTARVNYAFHKSLWLYYRKHLAWQHSRILNFAVAIGIVFRALISMAHSSLNRQYSVRTMKGR